LNPASPAADAGDGCQAPDLTHFSGIVPCGISATHLGVTSLRELGMKASMSGLMRRCVTHSAQFSIRRFMIEAR